MITPETLTRHELIGLPVRVADADSDAHIGFAGRVLRESARTLVVRTDTGDKRVPKAGTTFEFALTGSEPTTRISGYSEASVEDGSGPSFDTDEAAGVRKAPGSTSQLGSDTAGVRPRQSDPSSSDVECDFEAASRSLGECKDVVYVTVDGNQLLSRPAERTERGVSTWR